MLLELNKVTENEQGFSTRLWLVNCDDIIAVYQATKYTKVILRGFTSAVPVTDTVEEIEDALHNAQADKNAAFWDGAIPALAQAIELVARDIVDGGCVSSLDMRDLLRPATSDGSGVIPIAKGLRDKQADVQHDRNL